MKQFLIGQYRVILWLSSCIGLFYGLCAITQRLSFIFATTTSLRDRNDELGAIGLELYLLLPALLGLMILRTRKPSALISISYLLYVFFLLIAGYTFLFVEDTLEAGFFMLLLVLPGVSCITLFLLTYLVAAQLNKHK